MKTRAYLTQDQNSETSRDSETATSEVFVLGLASPSALSLELAHKSHGSHASHASHTSHHSSHHR